MPNLILFDDPVIRTALLPFTFTRPVAGVRLGIQTIAEKWAGSLNQAPSFLTESYLQAKFPQHGTDDNLYVNGAVCPTPAFVERLTRLASGESLIAPTGLLLALRTDRTVTEASQLSDLPQHTITFTAGPDDR